MNIKKIMLSLLLMPAALQAQNVLNNDFRTVAQFETYTVVDANDDGQTWQYDDLLMAAACTRDYDADDWLITPQLPLSAEKTYRLTVAANVESEGSEQLAVMIGQQALPASLTRTLLAPTAVSSSQSQDYSVIFTVSTSGAYHIGLHCMTQNDPFSNRLYINRVRVEETADQGVPAAVTDLLLTPGEQGALTVGVSFTTPDKTIGGQPLTQLTRVGVYRDNKLVKVFENPAIGQPLTYDDSGMRSGEHTYRVVTQNDKGTGEAASAKVYVGTDVPGPIENLRFVYDHATGQSHLSWDAPQRGAHGGYVDLEGVTYQVRRSHTMTALATAVTQTTFDDEVGIDFLLACEEETRQQYADIGMAVEVNYVVDGQGLMQYYVKAITPQGEGTETVSNSVIIGRQYELPFYDSFASGRLSHYWRTDIRTSMARWSAMADSRFPQDGDGGMLCFNAIEGSETAMCHTGNISMREAQTPVLTFYYYYDEAMAHPLVVKAASDGGDFQTLATLPMTDEGQKDRWLRASIPLTQLAGHDFVQIGFEATTATTIDVLYIDHVHIIDQRQNDLTVDIASVPRTLKVGQTDYLTASVENLGTADVVTGAYTVDVYVNSQKAGSAMGIAVEAGKKQSVMVPLTTTIDMQREPQLTQSATVRAEVVYAADEALSNNQSDEQTALLKMPRYPEPTQLQQTATTTVGIALQVQQPRAPRTEDGQVTDSFEDYDDFLRTPFGEWSLYDGDRALTYAIGGWHFPKNSDIMSWMIWTPSEVDNATDGTKGLRDPLWYPRTGDKMVASFGAFEANSDDWLISPELSGNQQVVSFYAHSMPRASAPDQFRLYVSTTGSATTNFMPLDQEPRTCPSEWERYEYVLPQGVKYFAIHKVTYDGWVMFVDDVTFAPDSLAAQTGLMLFGYNLYRNGERINTALIPVGGKIEDPEGKPGDRYRLTAVYNQGESVYSNEVVARVPEDVKSIVADDVNAPFYDLQGRPLNERSVQGIVVRKGRVVTVKP